MSKIEQHRTKKTLRLPSDLQQEIERAAAEAGRSANEEIVYRLRAYSQGAAIAEVVKQNAELKKMIQILIDRHG